MIPHLEQPPTKRCTQCGELKLVSEFSKQARKRSGLRPDCKLCASNAYIKWRSDNPDKARAASAKWQAANPEKKKASVAKWHAANADRVRTVKAKWRTENSDACIIHKQNRRARECESVGRLSSGIAERLYRLQRGMCACGCKQPLGDNYHRDHILPLTLGGANEDWNLQLLRSTCNLQKSTKHPVEFMQQRGFLL